MPSTNSISKLGLEEAAVKLFQMGIRSATDFQKLCNGQFNGLQGRPADIPSNPMMYFKEISNFKELLKLGQRLSEEIQAEEQPKKINTDERDVMSYEDLKQLVRKYNVTSIRQWKKVVKEDKLPGSFPSSPQAYYKDFEGWDLFLAPKIGAGFQGKAIDQQSYRVRLIIIILSSQHGKIFMDWSKHICNSSKAQLLYC